VKQFYAVYATGIDTTAVISYNKSVQLLRLLVNEDLSASFRALHQWSLHVLNLFIKASTYMLRLKIHPHTAFFGNNNGAGASLILAPKPHALS